MPAYLKGRKIQVISEHYLIKSKSEKIAMTINRHLIPVPYFSLEEYVLRPLR